jgi:hypothetical protein
MGYGRASEDHHAEEISMRCLFGIAVVLSVIAALIVSSPASAGGGPSHAAITITSNAGFRTCACVTRGSGTASSPYVIGPWTIKSPSGGSKGGWSVKVDDSKGTITAHFNITGITSSYKDTNPSDPDIWLVDIHTPTAVTGGTNAGTSTSSNGNGIGVRVDGSSNISLDGLSYNKSFGPGVYIDGSSSITLNNSKLKALGEARPNGDGVYAVNSSNLQMGTGADCPKSQPCNDTTYDDGFGYDLVNTHDVVIDNAVATANDTGGYLLDGKGTYDVTLENSKAAGLGPICVTAGNQKENTGYFTDLQGALMLVDGAHNNTFRNDNFNIPASAPMPSIGSGGNGFYVNACAGFLPQPWSGTIESPAANNDTWIQPVCYSLPVDYPTLPPSARNCPGS